MIGEQRIVHWNYPRMLQNPVIRHAAIALYTQHRDDYTFVDRKIEMLVKTDVDRIREIFVNMKPISDDYGLDWVVFVVIPAGDLLGKVEANAITFLATSFSILLVGMMSIALLLRMYVTNPLVSISNSLARVGHLISFTSFSQAEQWVSISEVSVLKSSFNKLAHTIESFTKFVPAPLVRSLVASNLTAELGVTDLSDCTVLFMDMHQFNAHSDTLGTELGLTALTDFFNLGAQVFTEHEATVDKFIGDTIMCFWNAPQSIERHHFKAVAAAIQCMQSISSLHTKWQMQGIPPLEARCGLHCGKVLVGNIGASDRFSYTVIGDTVNLASRIDSLAEVYNTTILISDCLHDIVQHEFPTRPIDVVKVKGKRATTTLYEVELRTRRVEAVNDYAAAFHWYSQQDYEKALQVLDCLQQEDAVANNLANRCRLFVANPSLNQSGVNVYQTK
eukprot:NODE_907_length_1772_cov_33.591489_g851_i0.p1 GENE.NODE_907_length_1772_cov_33.591489_g851_i0~~NODE_907_length_1772_cov_33.591489_g851_i0.p1  ORF type:complete len:447 (+),score=127.77 NODE_907_length_1772_cov_33.591489_g851_i0:344-1684(+)